MSRSNAWRQLWVVSGVLVLALSVWFSTAAVVPSLAPAWGISTGDASWLTTAVQIGFVAGALLSAGLNLPDRVPIHRLIATGAFAAAISNGLVPLFAHGLALALPLRFLTGMSLALVYPLGVKLMASWFDSGRALAVGIVVGALTLGSGAPQLVNAFGGLNWRGVLIATSALAAIGGVAATFLEEGPLLGSGGGKLRPGYVVEMFADREQRLINFGYFGHMWELYALWTWLPAFLAASLAASHSDSGRLTVGLISFTVIGLAGFAGCVLGGERGCRLGSLRVARLALLMSGGCCLASALVFGAAPWLLVIVLLAWGFSVIADSAQFSTALSEVADGRYVGTALTIQMAIGFMVTVGSIRTMPLIVDAIGWRWALSTLVLGPAVALLALRGLTSKAIHPAVALDR
jgi:MFS family permease